MNDNTTPDTDIAKVDVAWTALEKSLSDMGERMRSNTDQTAQQRYEGYKTVLAIFSEAYVSQLHSDPKHPELTPTVGSLFNFAGPAPDFNYYLTNVEPGESYRVWGTRGDCEMIDIQQTAGWYGKTAPFSVVNTANELFDEKGIQLDENGNFDFILSPKKHDGQWWPLDASVDTILIREYFTDYANQGQRSTFHIDRIAKDGDATRTTASDGAENIHALARSLNDYAYTLNLPVAVTSKVGTNKVFEFNFDDAGGALNQRYLQARWDIKPGQALVGKWQFPESCLNWSITLYNDFYQSLNYANRQININPGLATFCADHSLYFVLSHEDPGIVNWLDLDGHELGQVLIRTKNASAYELPELQLVDISELKNILPADVKTVTPEQRAEALATRRKHFHVREQR